MSKAKYTAESVGPRVEDFLRRLCKDAGFKVSFQVADAQNPHPDYENPEVIVKFTGPDVELLLANHADVLLALEHLAMEVLHMPPEDHTKLCFDADDYRILRMEELRVSAAAAAERVRRGGMPFTFNPMSSRERRIVHLAVRGESGVRSESTGFGSHRQVVIYPEGMTAGNQAAPAGPAGPQYSRRPRRR